MENEVIDVAEATDGVVVTTNVSTIKKIATGGTIAVLGAGLIFGGYKLVKKLVKKLRSKKAKTVENLADEDEFHQAEAAEEQEDQE